MTLLRRSAIDNIDKFGLQRGTSDQESVNVSLGVQLVAVLGVGRSTVYDTGFIGNTC